MLSIGRIGISCILFLISAWNVTKTPIASQGRYAEGCTAVTVLTGLEQGCSAQVSFAVHGKTTLIRKLGSAISEMILEMNSEIISEMISEIISEMISEIAF